MIFADQQFISSSSSKIIDTRSSTSDLKHTLRILRYSNYRPACLLYLGLRGQTIVSRNFVSCLMERKKEKVVMALLTSSSPPRMLAELLELKYITLEGLFKGAVGDWCRHPTYLDMEILDKHFNEENEDKLLARNYMYWSKDLPVTETISSILKGGVEQLKVYIEAVAKGRIRHWNDSGIWDNRIKVRNGGGILQGYVVMGFNRSRFLVRSTEPMQTSKEYNKILEF